MPPASGANAPIADAATATPSASGHSVATASPHVGIGSHPSGMQRWSRLQSSFGSQSVALRHSTQMGSKQRGVLVPAQSSSFSHTVGPSPGPMSAGGRYLLESTTSEQLETSPADERTKRRRPKRF